MRDRRKGPPSVRVLKAKSQNGNRHANGSSVAIDGSDARLQNALDELQTLNTLILASMSDVYALFDKGWRYVYVNQAAVDAIGRPREEILGRTLWELYPDLTGTDLEREFRQAMDRGAHAIFAVHDRTTDTWWENRFQPAPEGLAVFATNITEQKRAQEASRTYSRRLLEAQEAERRRISRELHDEIGQTLTAVKINLHALQQQCSTGEMRLSIRDNMAVIDEAVDQVRHLSVDLRPQLLDDFGLVVSLRWYLDLQAKNCGLPADFTTRSVDEDDRFASELETACFRITQEAISNVVRHAKATRISVILERSEQDLVLLISDNGAGFDISGLRSNAATIGLRGMEERVQAVGGSITIASRPDLGTEICARFPIPRWCAVSQ